MKPQNHYPSFEQWAVLKEVFPLLLFTLPIAIVTGSLVALFLFLLDVCTQTRWQYPWMFFFLPFAGIGIVWVYKQFGKNSDAGNKLLIDEIHEPNQRIPARIVPLVLGGTLVTHLFGGSAGREGTAVQMGGGITSFMLRWLNLSSEKKRVLYTSGIAAGFGAVFGTPVTGAVFAIEVLTIGKLNYKALLPALAGSVVADFTCTAWGISHTHYSIQSIATQNLPGIQMHLDYLLLCKVAVAGALFGFTGYLFAELSHFLKEQFTKRISMYIAIPVIGAVSVIGISYLLGTFDYLGLGVTGPLPDSISIVNAFKEGGVTPWSWWWKLLLTVITISSGFKGGEVTPLFFIGAALGNTFGAIAGAPVDLFAAIGFIAVFAAATNTPLACTIMGIELFGGEYTLYFALACFIAYYMSGHSGIYQSQRVGVAKYGNHLHAASRTLKEWKQHQTE